MTNINTFLLFKAQLELSRLKDCEAQLLSNNNNHQSLLLTVQNSILSVSNKIKELEETQNNTDDNIDELSSKAYGGDLEALQKLITLSAGGKNNPDKEYAALKAKQIIQDLALQGDNSICSVIFNSFQKDLDVLQSLVMGNSSYSQAAAENFAEYVNVNTSNITYNTGITPESLQPAVLEAILAKLCADPERNIHLIAKFSNTAKGIETLSDIAADKPTTHAGKIAVRALAKAFIEGGTKVSLAALKGLKSAALAGNGESSKVLTQIVQSNAVDYKKSSQVIETLTEIASSAGNAGADALKALASLAEDNNLPSKIKVPVIQNLGTLIAQGADQQFIATDALINVAQNSNQATTAKEAQKVIFTAAESNPQVLDRAVGLFEKVAGGNIPADNKMRLQAVELLGKAVQNQGPNSKQAVGALAKLTKNTNKLVAVGAETKLKDLGLIPEKEQINSLSANNEEVKNKDTKKVLTNNIA